MKKEYHNYNILVIEDNLGDFELINFYLKDKIKNLSIKHATNFTGAKQIIKQANANFDVILLDLSLPDLSGEQLTKEIVSISKNTPIIVLTGYEDLDFSIKSLSLGVSDYLLKDEITSESLFKDIIYSIERKKSSVKVVESEKRYSDLFHLSPQPMIVYDIETLQFLSVNDATIKSYGYSEEELLDMTLEDIWSEENLPQLKKTTDDLRINQQINNSDIYQIKKKDGSLIHVDVRSNAFYFKNKPARLVLATDITERIQYIKAIEQQNKKLQDIAYTQSHVVRAPLARIMAIVNLLEHLKIETAECKELLDHIVESGKELDEIIKDIVHKSEEIAPK